MLPPRHCERFSRSALFASWRLRRHRRCRRGNPRHCERFLRSNLALKIPLSLLLLIASASKLIAFSSFVSVLPSLAGMTGTAAKVLAASVIAVELTAGILLNVQRFARAAAGVSFCLFGGFAVILSAAVFRGVDVPCMCFGSLIPRIPLRLEALVDIVLCLVALACTRDVRIPNSAGNWFRARTGIALACGLLWGSLLLLWPHETSRAEAGAPPSDEFFSGASPLLGDYPAVTLVADFQDFACQLCLDDFLAFCDSLNALNAHGLPRVRLVARRDRSRTLADQSRMLEAWAAGNGYHFPVAVDTDSLFERSSAQKTSAIIWGKDGRLVDFARFPLGPALRSTLLRAIEG